MIVVKKIKVISYKNLPSAYPISKICIWFLMMERFNAPQWLWGSTGLFWVVVIIFAIQRHLSQEQMNIIDKP